MTATKLRYRFDLTAVLRIQEAVEDQLEFLSRLDISDPRFSYALEVFEDALALRKVCETQYAAQLVASHAGRF